MWRRVVTDWDVIGLVGGVGGRCPVAWKSKIGKRVARSMIEAEAISLAEALEMAMLLREV